MELYGLHYRTGDPTRVTIDQGRIVSVEKLPSSASAHGPRWLAPALFDVQVNGYAGVDFQQDHLSLEDLIRATRALRRDGCTQYFFTLITAEWPQLLARLRHARELRNSSPELKAAIAGWHIEGPFLSEKPGFCGAHDPGVMRDPTLQHIDELRAAAEGDRGLLTIAPERAGALVAIKHAVDVGFTVSLGHTDAPGEIIRRAVDAGATGFTHLANGCPRELDRHDNIVWRVCDTPGLVPSLIPDGIHVSPAPFRLFHRLLGSRTFFYTTDAMAAAGAPPGRYRIGRIEVEVGEDQIVRQPGRTNFAGSALRPIEAPFRAARMLQQKWQDCWAAISEAPARFVGMTHELAPGSPANLCLLSVTESGELQSAETWMGEVSAKF